MENKIGVFKNEQFGAVRIILIDKEPWFVGKDVAEILGYTNPSKALSDHVDDEDKLNSNKLNNETLPSFDLGQRGGWLINESGLYSLILSSRLPTAKAFKRWVTDEVLPSIRKYGVFMTPEALEAAMCNPDYLLKVVTALKKESDARIALERENAQLNERIETDKPLVEFANHVSTTDSLLNMSQFAKIVRNEDIDIGRNRLISWLKKSGYLMPNGEPYQQYLSQGLFDVKEAVKHTYNGAMVFPVTLITGKGQVYFVDKLKKEYKEAK